MEMNGLAWMLELQLLLILMEIFVLCKKVEVMGFTQDEIDQCGELSVRVGAKIREKLKEHNRESIKWSNTQKQKNLLKD